MVRGEEMAFNVKLVVKVEVHVSPLKGRLPIIERRVCASGLYFEDELGHSGGFRN
jgi:hypothetical protein